MTPDDTYAVPLTRAEACYLSDALSMHTPGPPDQELTGRPYKHLLLLIASAVRELANPEKCSEVIISLTEPELWVIREVAKTSVKAGTSERVGYNLLLKVGEGLLAFNNLSEGVLPDSSIVEEPWDIEGVKQKLMQRIEQQEAEHDNSPNADTTADSPGDEAFASAPL